MISTSRLAGLSPGAPGPCSGCTRRRPVLEPLRPCRIAIVGSGPGRREDECGLPFQGETGKETVQTFLPVLGFGRDEVYFTNVVKCVSDDVEKAAPGCGSHWLYWEISQVRPELIITLGSEAAAYFGIHDLEMNHGIPFWTTRERQIGTFTERWWSGPVIACYHVAAGLRSSSFMTLVLEGFRMAAAFLRGENTIPVNHYPNVDYGLARGSPAVSQYLSAYSEQPPAAAADTETLPGVPETAYCLSFSRAPGTARVIMADDEDGLGELIRFIRARPEVEWKLHNGLYDLPVFRQMAIEFPLWRDTMIRAYHQADMPKALKVLGWRFCGVHMTTFEDLTEPYFRAAWLDYLKRAASSGPWPVMWNGNPEDVAAKLAHDAAIEQWRADALAWGTLDRKTRGTRPRKPEAPKRGTVRQVDGIDKRAAAILTDAQSNPADSIDFLARWDAIQDRVRVPVEREIGPPPERRIDAVPVEEMVEYACADSDVTLRLDPILRARMTTDEILRRGQL